MARPMYWTEIQRRLIGEQQVIYEGICIGAGIPRESSVAYMRRYQHAFADVLGWDLQPDIPTSVRGTRWIRADISAAEVLEIAGAEEDARMVESLKSRVEALETLVRGGTIDGYTKQSARAGMRQRMVDEIVSGAREMGSSGSSPGFAEVQLTRESRVVSQLRTLLADPSNLRVSVLYGAGHTVALAARFEAELGLHESSSSWIEAITVPGAATPRSGPVAPK